MSTASFCYFNTSDTCDTIGSTADDNQTDYLQGMATVAMLFDMVDMERLITTRDRISPLSNTGALANIPTQVAYREYVCTPCSYISCRTSPAQLLAFAYLKFSFCTNRIKQLRFLTIKILAVNVPALALSPSWYIDQLWHSHILDTEPYAQIRERWPGRLQHDPVPAGSDEDQKNRLKQTLTVYGKL